MQYVSPSTGGTVNMLSGRQVTLTIDPAGTLATLTVNLPSNPQDGDEAIICTSQILTALTVTNGTIVGTLTTLALGGYARFAYSSVGKWFRIG